MIRIFLSYARADLTFAKRLYEDLIEAGYKPWLDKRDLLPGKNWKYEVAKAIQESDYFFALLSKHSINKKGFVQKELRLALEILDEHPIQDTFVIPIRLEECQPLDPRLNELHWADLFPEYERGLFDILQAIKKGGTKEERLPKKKEGFQIYPESFRNVRRKGIPIVFLAYRFSSKESQRFVESIMGALSQHPEITHIEITDGRVLVGASWADTIRERIRKAKIVVCDITDLRPDVMFELGFAYALNTPILPVIARTKIKNIPKWLLQWDILDYESKAALDKIVSVISDRLKKTHLKPTQREGSPIPSRVVWIGYPKRNQKSIQEFAKIAKAAGLSLEIFTKNELDYDVLNRASVASFLVVNMDESDCDAIGNFLCGAVSAKPKVGYGSRKFRRRVIVIGPEEKTSGDWVAHSLRRSSDIILISDLSMVSTNLSKYIKIYEKWIRA